MIPKAKTIWKSGRFFLGKLLAFTRYQTYEQITPGTRFAKLDGFDPQFADEVQKELIDRFGRNGTPPPRPEPNETVDRFLERLEQWFFHNGISEKEAEAGLDNGEC